MYEGVVQDLIDELGRLPGIGPKSAQRIAFYLLDADPVDVRRFAEVLTEVKDKVRFCATCGNVAESETCRICADPRRDPAILCVVEESKDVVAIERTREFRGRYHVLGGAISPIDGIGPDRIRAREIVERAQRGGIEEVILATNPNVEGEATATYLSRLLLPMGVRVSSRFQEIATALKFVAFLALVAACFAASPALAPASADGAALPSAPEVDAAA